MATVTNPALTNPTSIVGCGPTPNPCSPCFETFRFLRGGPCFNTNNPTENNVWWINQVGLPAGTPQENAIDPNNFQLSPPYPTYEGTEVQAFICDSTSLLILNLNNGKIVQLTQEDAFSLLNTCVNGVLTTSSPCATTYTGCSTTSACVSDGIVQFLALISIAPSCTWSGTGLTITLSPLRQSALYSNITYGNWCPFSFSIGNCNTQTVCASLLNFTTAVTQSGGTYGTIYPGYSYQSQYANLRFTLLNKCKVAAGGPKKAHYLGVDSLNKTAYLIFFGQLRLFGSFKIIVVSPIIDLRCIIFQPGLVIVVSTPLSLSCSTVVN